MKINEFEYNVGSLKYNVDENIYNIAIGTGLAWVCQFHVVALNAQDAVDFVVGYMIENEIKLYMDYNEIQEKCEDGETIEKYAENNNLIPTSNNSFYVDIVSITFDSNL